MDTVKRYEEHSIWKFLRWSGILVIIVGYIYVLPALFRSIQLNYINNNIKDFVFGIILVIFVPIMFYIAIATFIEFYTIAVKVELTEDKIIGYPWYGKKRFEMRYDEIEIIKDRSNIFPGLAITLIGNNRKMYISIYVYPLADVVEEIERRAVNLKESRLKKLKRDRSLWLHGKDEEK